MAQMHHRHGHQRSALKLAKRALERSQGQPWHFGIEACVKDINDSSTDGQD
jgi:hypothetical protein